LNLDIERRIMPDNFSRRIFPQFDGVFCGLDYRIGTATSSQCSVIVVYQRLTGF
jgi:hypothetical protein